MEEKKGTWLTRQIESAKDSINGRPEWMKQVSYFEGSDSGLVRSEEGSIKGSLEASGSPKQEPQKK